MIDTIIESMKCILLFFNIFHIVFAMFYLPVPTTFMPYFQFSKCLLHILDVPLVLRKNVAYEFRNWSKINPHNQHHSENVLRSINIFMFKRHSSRELALYPHFTVIYNYPGFYD